MVGINFRIGGSGGYNQQLGLNHFDLLIDWGWFCIHPRSPMFLAIDYFFHLVGNFGIAILIVTVIVKILFFLLANKSYASMAKMKAVQPQMAMSQGALRFGRATRSEAAAGDDGALQEGADQSAGRLHCRSPSRSPRCSSRSTRCCSSPSRCGTRRSSAGSTTSPRRTLPTFLPSVA